MSEARPLFVTQQETDIIRDILSERRSGITGKSALEELPVPTSRNVYPQMVCLISEIGTQHSGWAVKMRRFPDNPIYEVIPTGILDGDREGAFGLVVYYRGQERDVFIPYESTAEQFKQLCGFGDDVEVGLGAWVDSETEKVNAYLYRWRVMFTAGGGSLSSYIARKGQEDQGFVECFVESVKWFPNGEEIVVHRTWARPQIPAMQFIESPAKIEFVDDGDDDRWVVTREGDPREGEILYASLSNTGWVRGSAFWANWYPDFRGFKSYPRLIDGEWCLSKKRDEYEPVGPLPDGGCYVWWVWESGRWKEMFDSRAYKVLLFYTRVGWGPWYGLAGEPGWSQGFSPYTGVGDIRAGTLAHALWTGREWILSGVENANYRFFLSAISPY